MPISVPEITFLSVPRPPIVFWALLMSESPSMRSSVDVRSVILSPCAIPSQLPTTVAPSVPSKPIWAYGNECTIRPLMVESSASRKSRPHGRRNRITPSSAERVALAVGLSSGSAMAPFSAAVAVTSSLIRLPSISTCGAPPGPDPSIVTVCVTGGSAVAGVNFAGPIRLNVIVSSPARALAVLIAPRSVHSVAVGSSQRLPVSAVELTTIVPAGVNAAWAEVGRISRSAIRGRRKRTIRSATVRSARCRGIHRTVARARPCG